MTATGYTDTFNRTVGAGSLGTADSGQSYTLFGTASQFSVAPGTASIAITAAGNPIGVADIGSGLFVDISGRVAISSIPATNLATAGFVSRATGVTTLYAGSMMVATGGAMSLRFSKISGGLVTLSTVSLGLTYVANTFYNLRFQAYWSRTLQANVLSAKLWAIGATEPGGWQATTTDAAITDYTGGQQAGIYGRDESTTLGTVTTKFQNVVARSYNLPVPAATDAMCADPAVGYPKQTALQSLATAVDTAMATIDPLTSLAGLYPRVRVSIAGVVLTNQVAFNASFNALEFNIGTTTNLGYNPQAIALPVGVWLVTFEARLTSPSANSLQVQIYGGPGGLTTYMRPWPTQSNDQGVGGTIHVSMLTYVTDPTTPNQYGVTIFPTNTATTESVSYMALSAVKISDYFA
jgi:hypothetical protein